MTEAKMKLVVSSITAAVVVILCVMLVFLIIQFITLGRLKAQKADLDAQISNITNYNNATDTEIDFYTNHLNAVQDMYRAQGKGLPTDVFFK